MSLAKLLVRLAGALRPIPSATGLASLNIGYFLQSVTTVNVTISATDSQAGIIEIDGTLTGNRTVTLSRNPDPGAFALIYRLDASSFDLAVQFLSGTSITIPVNNPGGIVYGDGTNAQIVPFAGSFL